MNLMKSSELTRSWNSLEAQCWQHRQALMVVSDTEVLQVEMASCYQVLPYYKASWERSLERSFLSKGSCRDMDLDAWL